MTIRIRKATLNDLPNIQVLSQHLFEHERQFTDEFNMNWSFSEQGKKFFTKKIKSRKSFIILAEDGNTTVGYILITLQAYAWRAFLPIAEVTNLSVHPKYRRQGIGADLFEKARDIAKKRGAERMSVEALTDNVRAIKFYRSHGFGHFSSMLIRNID